MKIEKVIKNDSNDLTELTIRSKSYFYSKEQVEKWREDLTVSENYISEKEVYKLTDKNVLIGYYSFFKINKLDVKLDNLFIDPQFISQGYGKILMSNFLQRVHKLKYRKVLLDADPNVEKFYEQFGSNIIGKIESSIRNRFLSIMEIIIKPTHKNDLS